MKTFVTSDWHGFPIDRIRELLAASGFSDGDRLYVLGDVIDRKEDGVALLKLIMAQPNIRLLRGNHEQMLLDCAFLFLGEGDAVSLNTFEKARRLREWQANGAEPTVKALLRENGKTRQAILDYLASTPLYEWVTVGDKPYLLVHAGLGDLPQEDVSPERCTPTELLWSRPYLTSRYPGKYVTILGHTPTCIYSREYSGRILKTDTWWDIDTGAACGRAPMLLCLDDLKEYYLPQ